MTQSKRYLEWLRAHGYSILIWIGVVGIAYEGLLLWLPAIQALLLLLTIPWLFVVPGLVVTSACLPALDRVERATMSVVLSVCMNTTALLILIELVPRVQGWMMVLTILAVHGMIGCWWLWKRWRLRRHAGR